MTLYLNMFIQSVFDLFIRLFLMSHLKQEAGGVSDVWTEPIIPCSVCLPSVSFL